MTVPPVNSTDRCSPRVTRKNTAAAKVRNEMMLNTSAFSMNGMSRRILKNSTDVSLSGPYSALVIAPSASGRHTVPMDTVLSFFLRPYQRLTRPREKNTAENIEVRMPMQ